MRKIPAFVLIVAALQGCMHAAPQPGTAAPPEATAVVPAIASRFSACDLDALMASYAPGIEFMSPSTPQPIVGHAALRAHLAGACAGSFRPVMKVEAQRVRLLSAESAVATGSYTIGRSDRPGDKPWPAFFVVTLQKVDGRWLASTQATVPAPPP